MTDLAVRLRGVTKRFGTHTAVSGLDLAIPSGSVYGLLGPNGSGKTTSIRMIMGILGPDEGSVELLGGPPDHAHRSRVGYLPEERGMYKKMKVLDHLAFIGEIRGLTPSEGRRRAGEWLERLGLPEWADRKVEELSKGMQQKVQFVGTVLHEPDLLILDEPFSGLDPINQDALEAIVRDFHARGTTILFSTHLMDQAERLCEHVCLISQSHKVLDGNLRDLKAADDEGVVSMRFGGEADWLHGPEVDHVEREGESYRVHLTEDADPGSILRRGVEAGVRIDRFERVEPRLHEIFVKHAGAAAVVDGDPQLGTGLTAAAGVAS